MSTLGYSNAAERDIDQIVDYIARDNPRAAVAFAQRIERTCSRLARFPDLGTDRSVLGQGIRIFSVGRYVIYYRKEPNDRLWILRVIHGARDDGSFVLDD